MMIEHIHFQLSSLVPPVPVDDLRCLLPIENALRLGYGDVVDKLAPLAFCETRFESQRFGIDREGRHSLFYILELNVLRWDESGDCRMYLMK